MPQVRCLLGSKSYYPAGGGDLEAKMSTKLANWKPGKLQFGARNRCRLGFAGYAVRSRACLDASDVLFGFQELFPSWF